MQYYVHKNVHKNTIIIINHIVRYLVLECQDNYDEMIVHKLNDVNFLNRIVYKFKQKVYTKVMK